MLQWKKVPLSLVMFTVIAAFTPLFLGACSQKELASEVRVFSVKEVTYHTYRPVKSLTDAKEYRVHLVSGNYSKVIVLPVCDGFDTSKLVGNELKFKITLYEDGDKQITQEDGTIDIENELLKKACM